MDLVVRVSAVVDGSTTLRAEVSGPFSARELFIESDSPLDSQSHTPWAPALLPIAMAVKADMRLEGPVDPRVLSGGKAAQMILAGWYPHLRQVAIVADGEPDVDGRPTRGVGCFFSGGVDSFYSALRHDDRITHLIFVHGFDIKLDQTELATEVRTELRDCARELGKELVTVSTNLRSLSNEYTSWGAEYHGAALASVALALAPVIGEAIIPGSFEFEGLHPWGSHPALDSLWSSARVEIMHDSADVTRTDKARVIADNPIAMQHLRVCWENRGGAYNCGECEKCIRTMVNLRAAGVLDRCETLPHEIDLDKVRAMDVATYGDQVFVRENIEALRKAGDPDPQLRAALRQALLRSRASATIRFARRRVSRLTPEPVKPAIRRLLHR